MQFLLVFASVATHSVMHKWEAFKFVSGFFGLDASLEKSAASTRLTLIGAGFSRTGTKSLEVALLRLGHKVYDTRSMMELNHVSQWVEVAHQLRSSKNFTMLDRLIAEMEAQGYTATLDFPMNLFASAFAERRPSAKVLMSVRETEESWFEAWVAVNEILSIFILRPWSWLIDMGFPKKLLKVLYDFEWEYPAYPTHISRPLPWFEIAHRFPAFETDAGRREWTELHCRLRRELEAQLPSERFLAFDVRQGWEPLLSFIGIDDPALVKEAFPRVNDRASLRVVRIALDVLAVGMPVLIFLILWGLWRCVRCMCCRKASPKQKPN